MAVVVGTLTAYGTPTSYLATAALDGQVDNAVITGAAIDNTTNRHLYLKCQIKLGSQALTGSPGVIIRLIESLDGGTTYEDNDDKCYGITIPLAATTAAHAKISGTLYIPPGFFKLAVVNDTGATFATGGNSLDYVTFTPDSV